MKRKVLFAIPLSVLTIMLLIPQGYATVYQDQVNAGWCYPDCVLNVAIDDVGKTWNVEWSGDYYLVLPLPAAYLGVSIHLWDNKGFDYQKSYMGTNPSGSISKSYTGSQTWTHTKVVWTFMGANYIITVPLEIGLYIGGDPVPEYTLSISTTTGGTTNPAPGTYTYNYGESVTVTATADIQYVVYFWVLDGTKHYINPITVTMNTDHTLKAYFRYIGSGGGGGCPFLSVWNGSDYVDYGVINIHDVENDVIREVPVQAEDVGVAGYKVKFRLREGWEGLNYSHSLIDQVKLYAVDSNGNRLLCPLIKAEHSDQGRVLLNLLFSDDYRIDTYLMDTIDLTFIMPYPTETIENFTFIIEGHNPLKL